MDALSRMPRSVAALRLPIRAIALLGALSIAPASAAERIQGQVLGAGAPIANSTVTLFAASAGAPKQLAQASTGADGRFTLNATGAAARTRRCTWSRKAARRQPTRAAATTRPSR